VPRVAHVVIVVFENHERGDILGTASAPTFNRLAADYAQATDAQAVAHPSLPNYLALVSGSTHGVTSDCTDCMQAGPTIASQLAAKHRSALTYAEGYPSSSRFAKKHVPFLYFPQSVSHVVGIDRFDARHLPAYAMVVPDLCHDMHDCSVAEGDRWLKRFIGPLLTTPDTASSSTRARATSGAEDGSRSSCSGPSSGRTRSFADARPTTVCSARSKRCSGFHPSASRAARR
jgi:hypothetical protein